jgi:hypothetical protein
MKWIKGVFTAFLIMLFMLIFSTQSFAAQVTLTWDPNSEPDLAGYKLYYGNSSGNYQWNIDVGNVTSYSLTLAPGIIYHLAATAYNTQGLESGFSNEVEFSPGGNILWNHTSGEVSLWKMGLNFDELSSQHYGPFPGWIAASFVRDSIGTGNMLWNHTSGEVSLWKMDSNLNEIGNTRYGPFPGWKALNYFKNSDGSGHILWKNVTTGETSLWNVNSNYVYTSHKIYGPYPGWIATSVWQ